MRVADSSTIAGHAYATQYVRTAPLAIFKMTVEELRQNLLQLVETYVIDPRARDELQSMVSRADIPAKGPSLHSAGAPRDRNRRSRLAERLRKHRCTAHANHRRRSARQ